MEFFSDPANIDPNLVYIALLAGLWIGVTAAYLPGSGIAEAIAFILLGASIIVLTFLPTNWAALIVLILGVSAFLVLPFVGERYAKYAEAGLALQAVGSYFLLQENPISPLLIAITVLLGVAYNRMILIPTMQNQHKHTEFDEANEVIGVRGRVVKDLNPVGTVYVNKELWRARSDEYLPKDTPVLVIAKDGLELIVEKAKNEDTPVYHHHGNGAAI